jgi:hypothetical protein
MTEIVEPAVLNHETRRKLKVRPTDLIVFAIMAIVIVVLAITLTSKLQLKHDVSNARVVSDKVITDIGKRDGVAVRSLGDKKFQSLYTADQLTTQFKNIALVTGGKATVDKQIVGHGKNGKTVFIVYKYPPKIAKQPYFISVSVSPDKNGTWHLTHIGGSADESTALGS